MIELTELHTFIDPPITAASGLVFIQDYFYVVADDELFLYQFSQKDLTGKSFRIFSGKLPDNPKERKKIKPDLESLVLTANGLLGIPSGSKENRTRGFLVPLNGKGDLAGPVEEVSFSSLFTELAETFPQLNIEGAVSFDKTLRLFQRGNGPLRQNAIIDVNLGDLLRGSPSIQQIQYIDLGTLQKVPLSFTDASLDNNIIYFLASAEDSPNTYDDGLFVGAVLGRMSLEGILLEVTPLECSIKPEGLCVFNENLYLVTDADDRSIAAKLLKSKHSLAGLWSRAPQT